MSASVNRTTLSTATTLDGFEVHAWYEYDDNNRPPDEDDEGFWPNPDDFDDADEYVKQRNEARSRWNAWHSGDWHYVGVCVQVKKCGVALTPLYGHALWHIESDSGDYLAEAATELTDDALDAAREMLERLKA